MKSRKQLQFVLITLCFPFSLFFNIAYAAQFSADLVITSPQAEYVYALKAAGDRIRLEKIKGPMTVPPFPTIYDRSSRVTWGLNTQARQYVEEKDPARTILMNPIVGWEFMRKDLKATPAGSETVEGYPCRVVDYRRPGDSRVSHRVWHSDELGFDLKEEAYAMNGTATMALRNIKQGPLDAEDFEIPPGYTLAGGTAGSAASAGRPSRTRGGNILLILDASGSMWGQVEGRCKIEIAKEVLSDLIRDLPDDSVVGLTAYGHRRKGDCGDVEELVPLGVIDKDRLIKTVHGLKPKGKTPITLSVRMAAEKIRHLEEETTIILVSDGEETCEGDPCALVRELKEAGIHFVMHVIGFDVTEKERVQLQCMADAGGGRYYTANSAHEFQTAAREVVREKTVEKGFLRLTALRGDTPFRAAVEVRAAGESTVIKGGVTGTDPERPGASIVPGVYDLRFQDVEMPDHPDVWIRGVEVKAGETVERTAVFPEVGILHVKAIRESAPAKVYFKLYQQEDDKYLGDGWTREDGTPAEFELEPGTYKIRFQDQSVRQRPEVWVENVVVHASETVERTGVFGRGGILHVKAIREGVPAKAYFKLYQQEDDKYLGDGWTREDGTPAEFKLAPGTYKIRFQDQSVRQRPEVWVENVVVKADETVERFATLQKGGVLRVTATLNGEPHKTYIKVYQQEDDKYLGDGWTQAGGKVPAFHLLPGKYYVTFKDPETKTEQVLGDLSVEPGKAVTANAAFPVEEKPPARGENPVPAPTPGQGGDADNEPLSTSSRQAGGKDLE